ncbi:MAG: isoaspartyl peptidase/L-asparaginase [Saprospiraceae bacterium]|nr:isoaspartyl peptidase/L-asparaginase [Saprospiraceae bacterium]
MIYNFGIAIHGGAGTILKSRMTEEKESNYKRDLALALNAGYKILENGGSSLDAVETAIIELENSHLFNAGKGAVFNANGQHEMDASIMEGKTLECGAVAAVRNLKNPISLAKNVLNHSDHVLLIGDGARQFAERFNTAFEPDEYFHDDLRFKQWQKLKDSESFQLDHSESKPGKYLGTVGAVALDKSGNLAAGTSTGGMTNKKFGRVGDSPIIGSGTYANNKTCAVSCTGSGEFLMRGVTAYDVSCLMEYKKLSLDEAANEAIMKRLLELGGDGGIIAIDIHGNISMPFNCEGMYRGFKNQDSELIAIYR